jgi:DNA polymerase-3 subunit delta'
LRDILMIQLNTGSDLVNQRFLAQLQERAELTSVQQTLFAIDHIQIARDRIAANTPPQLALEAMLIAITGRVPIELIDAP